MKSGVVISILVIAALAGASGWYLGQRGSTPTNSTGTGRKILYYQSAMHPWIKSDKPGRCTICGMRLSPVYEGESGVEQPRDIVSLSSNAINVINVQTDEVTMRPLERKLQVAGRIESDQTRNRVISAYVDGRIDKLFLNYVGAEVQANEPLALLYSPALLTAEREYITMLTQTNLASGGPLAEERERVLESSKQRLRRLGIGDEQIKAIKSGTNFLSEIRAPLSGTVVNRFVFEGQYVKEGDKLFEISDLSKMWFVFDVYEQDLSWIVPGQMVTVTAPSLPGKAFDGKIAFIDPNINQATRTAPVRVELDNPLIDFNGKKHRELYNGLYAHGIISIRTEPVLAVARSAVLQPGHQARVYVDQGGGAFEQREVRLGRKGENFWEILDGLEKDEKVVTNGNLLLDNQAELNRTGVAHSHQQEEEQNPHQHK